MCALCHQLLRVSIGVLLPRLRRIAGIGLILLSLAVLPVNVKMLLNSQADGGTLGWRSLLIY